MPAHRLLLACLALLAPALASPLLAPPLLAQAPPGARLAAAFGPVTLRAPGGDAFAAAASGTPVADGSALRTGAGGRAVLALPEGRLALEQGGHLDLARLAAPTQAMLTRGTLAVELRAAPDAPLQVATPRGVAEIGSAGRYLVEAGDAAQPMRLTVLAGAARLVTPAGSIPLAAGQAGWIPREGLAQLGPAGPTPLLGWLAGEAPAAPAPPAATLVPVAPPAAQPAPQPPSSVVIVQEPYPVFVPGWGPGWGPGFRPGPPPLPPLRPDPGPPFSTVRPPAGSQPNPGPPFAVPDWRRPGLPQR